MCNFYWLIRKNNPKTFFIPWFFESLELHDAICINTIHTYDTHNISQTQLVKTHIWHKLSEHKDMARELYHLLDLINMEIMPVSLFFLGVTYPFNIIRFDKRLKIYLSILNEGYSICHNSLFRFLIISWTVYSISSGFHGEAVPFSPLHLH